MEGKKKKMPSLIATTSAISHTTFLRTHYLWTNKNRNSQKSLKIVNFWLQKLILFGNLWPRNGQKGLENLYHFIPLETITLTKHKSVLTLLWTAYWFLLTGRGSVIDHTPLCETHYELFLSIFQNQDILKNILSVSNNSAIQMVLIINLNVYF